MRRRWLRAAVGVVLCCMATERILLSRYSAMPPSGDSSAVAPFQFVLSGDEKLRCQLTSAQGGSQVAIKGRMLRPSGEILPFSFVASVDQSLSTQTSDFALGPGALLTIYAQAIPTANGSVEWGDNYVSLWIVQGDGPAAIKLGVLVQSYVSQHQPAVYPGTPFRSSFEGPGVIEVNPGGNGGLGTNFVFAPVQGTRFRVLAFHFRYVAGPAVATRRPGLIIRRGGFIVGYYEAPIGVVASQTAFLTFVPGATPTLGGSGSIGVGTLPNPCWMEVGTTITLQTDIAMPAADQYVAVMADTERWLVVPGQSGP
jgi:hypothetical protein